MTGLPKSLGELIDHDPVRFRVHSRETKGREFKELFSDAEFSEFTKILASFANTEGGCLIFGVSDKPRHLVGIDLTSFPDETKWQDRLASDFHPEIPVSIATYEISGKFIAAVHVAQLPNRPAICCKSRSRLVTNKKGDKIDHDVIREGSIYYRYSAASKHIAHSELAAMLAEREERRMRVWLDTLKAVERVGYDRVAVVNATKLGKDSPTNLYISRETARSLNFIEKGSFVETTDEGDPAFVVVGNVMLNKVIAEPLADEDRNFPSEAAKKLSDVCKEVYPFLKSGFAATHISKLLAHFGLEKLPYSLNDKKVGRRFVTREGLRHLEDRIRAAPGDAINVFGSKQARTEYAAFMKLNAAIDAALV